MKFSQRRMLFGATLVTVHQELNCRCVTDLVRAIISAAQPHNFSDFSLKEVVKTRPRFGYAVMPASKLAAPNERLFEQLL